MTLITIIIIYDDDNDDDDDDDDDDLVRARVGLLKSHSYMTGVTEAKLRWYPSNMNVLLCR